MRHYSKLILSLLGLLLLQLPPGTGAAMAASSEWDRTEHSAVRLLSAVEGSGSGAQLPFGLEFQLSPGWKIYWRTPGDAGFPPIPDWSPSANVADVTMEWPRPERFEIFDLETLGYKDSVVFPLSVKPVVTGRAVTLAAKIPYLVCADICIPYEANLSLDLPAGPDVTGKDSHLISQFKGRVPIDADQAGINFPKAGYELLEDRITLRIAALSENGFIAPDLIVEGPEGSYFHKPAVTLDQATGAAIFTVEGGGVDAAGLTNAAVTITLWDDTGAVQADLPLTEGLPPLPATSPTEGSASLATILGFALLGGLILNLMPCVLPVLSLKLLSVVSHGGGAQRDVRIGFIASAAGIITAFLILGGVLSAMKLGGVAVGWGIQFQNPVFITFMVLVVTLFAANLLGLFQINLPGRLSDLAATAGQHQKGLAGHFTTGMFATLLATPCSAPFLGPAVGFALSQGAGEILLVFATLGLGLSLPYLLIAALPGLVTFLPRPGAWMNKLKLVLSLALFGTGIWLLTILDSVAGGETVTVIAAFAALILAVLMVRTRLPAARLARMAPAVVLLLMASAVTAASLRAPDQPPSPTVTEGNWVPFDEAAIPALIRQGHTVFVDVTADWCITCLYNKKNVLDADPVAGLLSRPEMVLMRADWTRPDPAIADYLNRHGRYGIPFNIVYGPGNPQGVALSEFLISDDVVAALEAAGGTGTAVNMSQK